MVNTKTNDTQEQISALVLDLQKQTKDLAQTIQTAAQEKSIVTDMDQMNELRKHIGS